MSQGGGTPPHLLRGVVQGTVRGLCGVWRARWGGDGGAMQQREPQCAFCGKPLASFYSLGHAPVVFCSLARQAHRQAPPAGRMEEAVGSPLPSAVALLAILAPLWNLLGVAAQRARLPSLQRKERLQPL